MAPTCFSPFTKKGRRRIHAETLSAITDLFNAGIDVLSLQAGLDGLPAHAGLPHGLDQAVQRFVGMGPALLLRVEEIEDRIPFVLTGATRQHKAGCGERIEREFPNDEAHLTGFDILGPERRLNVLVKIHAVMAGH